MPFLAGSGTSDGPGECRPRVQAYRTCRYTRLAWQRADQTRAYGYEKELSPPVIVEPQLAAGSPTKSVVMHHSSERRLEVNTTAGTRVAASFSLYDKGPTLSEKVESMRKTSFSAEMLAATAAELMAKINCCNVLARPRSTA